MLVVPEPPVARTTQPAELELLEPHELPASPAPGMPVAAPPLHSAAKPSNKPQASKPKRKVRWPLLAGVGAALIAAFAGFLYYVSISTDVSREKPVVAGAVVPWVDRGELAPPEENPFDTYVRTLPEKATDASTANLAMRDIVKLVEPSIVKLDVVMFDGSQKIGSGFFVDTEGKIFTNEHVINRASEITVSTADGRKTKALGFLVADADKDLAIVQVDPSQLDCVPIAIASKLPQKGDDVAAFGHPQGMQFSYTEGTVSAIRTGKELRQIIADMSGGTVDVEQVDVFPEDMVWIQHSASISGGNSGGPLVNMRGEMIGVNTWTHREGQNLNFASTKDQVRIVFADRKEMLLHFEGKARSGRSSAVLGTGMPPGGRPRD